ncbi:hypothetical protein WR25_19395 [Diploscapter pachys]|uniref:Fibroblast growth factor n=1 Tax=Diploscapter pachys TaxID=2018661 RepID=A0A2A2K9C0_9BILA|nr:hypothetical protein WR25_19395 [Diploscapter pachys]
MMLLICYNIRFSECLVEVEGETHWQLHNQCSQGMLQTYMGHVNARGKEEHACLTEFRVQVNREGAFQLQHAQSRRYLCFNRRSRITLRLSGNTTRCFFHERISDNGYSFIESAWKSGLFLGFNSRGRFQDPATFAFRQKCFNWMKFERYVSADEKIPCDKRKHEPHQPKKIETHPFNDRHLRQIMRESVLSSLRPVAEPEGENINFDGSSKFIVKLTAYRSL